MPYYYPMTLKHIHIMLPGLDRVPPTWLAPGVHAAQLLRIADAYPNIYAHPWDRLAVLFNVKPPLPAAAILADLYQQSRGYYVIAELTEFKADLTTVFCLGKHHLQVTDEEAESLIQDLKTLLPPDVTVKLLTANTWLIKMPQPIQLETLPLTNILSKQVPTPMLRGKDAPQWQRLQTELQMVWHVSPVNQQRQAANLPLINALWLSGEGELPQVQSIPKWQYVWTDDAVTEGLATWAGCQLLPFTKEKDHPFQIPTLAANWQGVVVINQLLEAELVLDSWQQQLHQLDQQLFKPLLTALHQRQLNRISIWLGGEKSYVITRGHRWRFWRRQRALSDYWRAD